jgi:PAS domain S-box-containing protein
VSDSNLKVLLIEDNSGDARLIREMLLEVPQTRFELEVADRLATGLGRIRAGDIRAVLLDLGLPDSQGYETFVAAHREAPHIPIIVLTGLGDEALALRTVKGGAQDYLVKGQVDAGVLERTIRYAVERKNAEEALRSSEAALRQSEASFRSLVVNSPFAIFRVSLDGRFLDANPALVDMLGYGSDSELMALDLCADIHSDSIESKRLVEFFTSQAQFRCSEVRWKRKDSKPITVSLTGRPVRDEKGTLTHFEMIAEDITKRRALEAQLRQAQKMESVGRLAGGIAHDFNNMLGVILGYSEVLEDRLEENPELRRHAEQIKKAGLHAASLTRQLLAFSRQQVLEPRVLNLNTVVAEMEKMLRPLIGEDIELATALDPQLGQVKADEGQIGQVIMNLAVNARDAMPDGGKLVIETRNIELDEEYALRHPPTVPGNYVMLVMTDTGVGMNMQTQAHIFEPFFTTKEVGKGTGLGLATVYGVIKQSGGHIWVYSEPGLGSTFTVYLPRVEQAVQRNRTSDLPTDFLRGSETVLLVEDEESLRSLTRTLLEQTGYTVLEGKDVRQALEIARQHRGPIHLLLTDMVMPGMIGRELAEEVASIRPEVRVIYMSGYMGFTRHGMLDSDASFLPKPFTQDALLRKVHEVLNLQKEPAI